MSKTTIRRARLTREALSRAIAATVSAPTRLAERWRTTVARRGQLAASLATTGKHTSTWARATFNIHARLALWCATLMAAILLLLSFVTYTIAAGQLEGSVQLTIKSRAEAISAALMHEQSVSRSVLPTPVPTTASAPGVGAVTTPVPASTPDPASQAKIQQQLSVRVPDVLGRLDLGFEVLDSKGDLKYVAATLGRGDLPLDLNVVNGVLRGDPPAYYTATMPATPTNPSSLLSIYVQPLIMPPASAGGHAQIVGVVLVAKSLDDVIRALSTLREVLLLGDIFAIALASLGGWFIADRGLRPVSTVTRTAHEIAVRADVAGLDTRVPYNGPPDEIGELVTTFNDMLAALARITTAQQRFVQDASHELRAPLTSIKGNLELLRRRADIPDAERAEMLGDAEAEAGRLATLVNDLLMLARLDAAGTGYGPSERWLDEQLRGRRELVALDEVVMSVFRQGRAQLPVRRKELQLVVRELQPLVVRADPGQIRQLVFILVDNAIKYTPNGRSVRLSLADAGDGWAELRVADSGIGIAPADLPHVFDRFYRADHARVRDEQGSGLGLAIAKWIVAAHGGTIGVSSTPGEGSTFTVRLKAEPRTPSARLPSAPTGATLQPALPDAKRARRAGSRIEALPAGSRLLPLARLAMATAATTRWTTPETARSQQVSVLHPVRAVGLARRGVSRFGQRAGARGMTRRKRYPSLKTPIPRSRRQKPRA
jgi:signal transduction histidine kinase